MKLSDELRAADSLYVGIATLSRWAAQAEANEKALEAAREDMETMRQFASKQCKENDALRKTNDYYTITTENDELKHEVEALTRENKDLKEEGIARLVEKDRAFVTDEMLAKFNSASAYCGFHNGLWSYTCPVCREWNRRVATVGKP